MGAVYVAAVADRIRKQQGDYSNGQIQVINWLIKLH